MPAVVVTSSPVSALYTRNLSGTVEPPLMEFHSFSDPTGVMSAGLKNPSIVNAAWIVAVVVSTEARL
jgi:hypothetical protein